MLLPKLGKHDCREKLTKKLVATLDSVAKEGNATDPDP